MLKTSRNFRGAFSLIEVAIVLGVLALVIGGIWAAASSVSEKRKLADALSGLISISGRATSIFSRSAIAATPNSGAVGGADVAATLINASAIPAPWVRGTSVVDPWGEPMDLLVITTPYIGTEDGTRFVVRFKNMPIARCKQLVAAVPGRGLLYIYSSGAAVTYFTLPVNINGGVCNVAGQSISFAYASATN